MTSETARGRATRTMPATAFEMLLPRPVWVVVAVGMAALSLFVSGAAVESVVGGSGWGAAGTAVAIAGAVTAWLMTATVVTITLVRPPLRGTATRMPGHEASSGVALRGSHLGHGAPLRAASPSRHAAAEPLRRGRCRP